MRLAFYKANSIGATWIDRMIDRRSGRGGYSHVELLFSNGESFSSSGRDGGCRFKDLDVSDPATWEIVGIGGTDEQEAGIREFCMAQDGKKYDYFGVMGFVFTDIRRYDRPGYRWFCSEVCTAAVERVKLWTGDLVPLKTSPNVMIAQTYRRKLGVKLSHAA